MKVLLISTDAKVLEEGSEVCARMLWYASAFESFDILLITKNSTSQNKQIKISDQVTVYPQRYWQTPTWRPDLQVVGYDVVSAQDPFENGLVGWWLARQFNLPLQLQIHTDFLSQYFWRESLKNKVRVMVAKWLLPKAKNIRVVSQKIKDSLVYQLKIAPEKIVVLPVWINLEQYQNNHIATDLKKLYPQFTKIVLVASRLTREKNIGLVLQAFKNVVDQVPGVGLVVVGDGPEQAGLKALVKKLKIEDRVVFFGWSDDLASCYKTADVFVNTSWYEGFGRTIIEALACGCLVVSTDVGVAVEAGAVISDFTAEDLSNKIVGVLVNNQRGSLPTAFKLTQTAYLDQFVASFKI